MTRINGHGRPISGHGRLAAVPAVFGALTGVVPQVEQDRAKDGPKRRVELGDPRDRGQREHRIAAERTAIRRGMLETHLDDARLALPS